jgi:hypothetical protein
MLSIALALAVDLALAMVASIAPLSWTPAMQTAPPTRAEASAPRPRRAAAPTTLAARGRIVAFDQGAHSLTIATTGGEERFTLDEATRIRHASRAISGADLAKLTGHQATVRYHESAGQKHVLSVRVASAPALAESKTTDSGGLP